MKTVTLLFLFVLHFVTGCNSDNLPHPAGVSVDPVNETISLTDSVMVCMGKSSYAYHKQLCRGLDQCHAAVKKMVLSTALAMNRKPCHYCYGNQSSVISGKYAPATENSQCTAITRKGTRCKRKAKSNGLCWQHGGEDKK